jgi:DNA-3-methyladenine glycosylase II
VRFTLSTVIPVRTPYRLDLTVDALRRLAANVVDVESAGVYRRALADDAGVNMIEVRQASPSELAVRVSGRDARRWIPTVEKMLGTQAGLGEWYERAAGVRWLAALAAALEGLKPPRYPSLFEALSHAIVFQQISIHAAASIMRRFVTTLGEPVEYAGVAHYPFPRPQNVLQASDASLRAAGLSANKVAHLRSASEAVLSGAVSDERIGALPTEEAIEELCAVRGIGRWSAAVVMLRGFGRLDIFPMKDSGVARSVKLLSGDPDIDLDRLLDTLGPARGMLYFHLLLGRIRNLVP